MNAYVGKVIVNLPGKILSEDPRYAAHTEIQVVARYSCLLALAESVAEYARACGGVPKAESVPQKQALDGIQELVKQLILDGASSAAQQVVSNL